MDILNGLMLGLDAALNPVTLLYCFIGVFLGTLIGVLPGIGALATISLLLPVTYHIPPTAAIVMLAGVYYGAQYGGSTTAILINMPGESSSAVTAIDGYQMARQGRAGTAPAGAAACRWWTTPWRRCSWVRGMPTSHRLRFRGLAPASHQKGLTSDTIRHGVPLPCRR